MKKRILSLLLCLCMVLALLPSAAFAAAGESDVAITVQQGAATATVRSKRLEVESVTWSDSAVIIKVKVKDDQPFTVFAKDAASIYVTVNNKETKQVQRLDDKHIVVTYPLVPAQTGGGSTDANTVVLQPAHTKEELNKKWEECRPTYEGGLFETAAKITAPYAIGKPRDAAVEDALNYFNFIRYMEGLSEVKLDPDLQDRAQYGAVLLAASGQFSHTPFKPADMSNDFYQRGYASTTNSNICSIPLETRALVEGILNLLADSSSDTNIAHVGHRRWFLNPKLDKTGFGAATGRDGRINYTVECMSQGGKDNTAIVAWPAPGYHELQCFRGSDPYSLSLDPNVYDKNRTQNIKVKLTVTHTDGREQSYTFDASDKDKSGEYFNVSTNPYGLGFAVIFRKNGLDFSDGVKTTAEVSGIYKKGSDTPVTIRWDTEFFYAEYFNFSDMEFDDVIGPIELEMENHARALRHVADNTVTEADLVRAALYPLRSNRQISYVGTHDFSKTPADEANRKFGNITTTIDLTYHDRPFSVKVSSQITRYTPEGDKAKALEEMAAALKAAGNPHSAAKATEVAAPIGAKYGFEVTCQDKFLSTNDNPAYKGLERYEVSFKTEAGTHVTYTIVYDNGKGLEVYLPLGSIEMPAVGAVKKTVDAAKVEIPPLVGNGTAAAPEPTPTPTPAPAAATDQSGSKSLPKLSQTEIAALVKAAPDTLNTAPFEAQPSVKAPYATGKVSSSALQAAADRLTMLRRLAGLPGVELDASLNEQAQYGAVLLAASGDFSHTPSKPADMDDDFYQKGRSATSSSNLHYYSSSGMKVTNALYVLAKAPDELMDDSDSSNVERVGHRRWQLNPTLQKVGFGLGVEQSDGWVRQYVTEKVYDTSGSTSDYDFISWPASGNFPNDLQAFNKDTAWSVTLNPGLYAKPEKSALTVTLKRTSDGKTWVFSGNESTVAADSGKYFGVDNSGRGVSNCIIFRPDGVTKYEGAYTVQIDGLTTTAGTAASLCYQVEFFDSNNPSAQAAAPAIPATGTAYPSTQTVDLDGKKVSFQMYALKDQNGNPTNYVKVRDLALALSGTKAQFSVGWDGAVNLAAGSAYTPNGSENSTPYSGERAYTLPASPTNVNGGTSDLQAIVLTDDAGGGFTYYQLRDLGRKLGFNVDWSAEKGVYIETDKPYSSK